MRLFHPETLSGGAGAPGRDRGWCSGEHSEHVQRGEDPHCRAGAIRMERGFNGRDKTAAALLGLWREQEGALGHQRDGIAGSAKGGPGNTARAVKMTGSTGGESWSPQLCSPGRWVSREEPRGSPGSAPRSTGGLSWAGQRHRAQQRQLANLVRCTSDLTPAGHTNAETAASPAPLQHSGAAQAMAPHHRGRGS